MTIGDIGKRFERLLLLVLPLSLLSVSSSLLAFADYTFKFNSERIALRKISETLDLNSVDLKKLYDESLKPSKTPSFLLHHPILQNKDIGFYAFVNDYRAALAKLRLSIESKYQDAISASDLSTYLSSTKAPKQIADEVHSRIKALDSVINIAEVTLPVRPSISLLGNSFFVPISVLCSLGFFLSCLGLIFWLGAIRLTRKRELFAYMSHNFNLQLFPHLLNNSMTLIVNDSHEFRGRNARMISLLHKAIIFLLRTTIFSLIAGLTVLPLIYSFVFLPFDFLDLSYTRITFVPSWIYFLAIFVPSIQLFLFYVEEIHSLTIAPVRILLRGRDIS